MLHRLTDYHFQREKKERKASLNSLILLSILMNERLCYKFTFIFGRIHWWWQVYKCFFTMDLEFESTKKLL